MSSWSILFMESDEVYSEDYSNILESVKCNISLLNSCVNSGGYISANKVLYKNIPNDDLFKDLLSIAVKGTPIIKIGNMGPKVMIVAGIHGNELPPQLACLYLINYLLSNELRGTVYLIPFAAPNATMNNSRSFNGMDLNRSTLDEGSISNIIYNIVVSENIEAVADFHSTSLNSNPGRESVFSSSHPTEESYDIGRYIASKVGCQLINYTDAGILYKGALEDECNKRGIPAVTCEVLSPFGFLNKNSYKRSLLQMYEFLTFFNII